MHRALQHPDILSLLFIAMASAVEESEGDVDFIDQLMMEAALRSTLLRCALVCRAFCDPALSALWYRLDNLVPFLRLLSCFVPTRIEGRAARKSATRRSSETLYALKGEPAPAEWARFRYYARHVRILNYPKLASVTPHIVSRLSKWNDGAPLLPGLRDLTWLPASSNDTAALLLGTGNLEHLQLVLDCIELPDEYRWLPRDEKMDVLRNPLSRNVGEKNVEKLLATYAERTPHLKILDLNVQVHPLCLVPVARFTLLTSLRIEDTPVDAWFLREIAAKLTSLETLNIQLLLMPQEPDAPIVGLRHLSALDVTGQASDLTRLFMMLNTLSGLRTLVLTFLNGIPELTHTYRRPLEVLRARGHAPGLLSCKLDISTRWNTKDTLAQLVEPLLDVRTLDHVAVNVERGGYQVTEGDIERMARAWPKLRELALIWNARAGGACPPVQSLAHLANHCPELRTIIMSHIDTTKPLPPPPYKMGNHGLLHLLALDSYPIADPKAVGRYISAMFPHVMVAVPDPQPSGWDHVLHMAGAWKEARAKHIAQLQAYKRVGADAR